MINVMGGMHGGRDASARQSGKLPQFFDLETIRETQTQKTVCVVCRQEGLPPHDLVRLVTTDLERGQRSLISNHPQPSPPCLQQSQKS